MTQWLLVAKMNCLLLDLDGVVYRSGKAIEGAREAIAWCKSGGIPHLFLTNTSSRPRTDLVRKLDGMRITVDADSIFTPPVAARHWLAGHVSGPSALFVPEATRSEFQGCELLDEDAESGASAVVIGDLGLQWDFRTLNRAFRLLMNNPDCELIALGMTRYWNAEDGLRLDVAPFIKALEHASGRSARVIGKPSKLFFDTALSMLKATPDETMMIGDDINADVAGAQNAGIRGIMVKTGKYRPEDLDGDVVPDAILDSIADLPKLWGELARDKGE